MKATLVLLNVIVTIILVYFNLCESQMNVFTFISIPLMVLYYLCPSILYLMYKDL